MNLTDPPPEPDRYPFQLRTAFTGEVLKEISLLRWDCSSGVDQIPVKYVKQVGDFLTGPFAHIINVCISNSQFPRIWKTARISSVRKVDNPKQNADYRPVSILPALSKVFERLACESIRFSSLFAAGDVFCGGTSATQRQKFHTDDLKSVQNPVRGAD